MRDTTNAHLQLKLTHFRKRTYFFYFIFKIINLLHGARRQTVVATFVTTYIGRKLKGKLKKGKKKKKKKKRNKI